MDIDVYCVKGFSGNLLKVKLEEALEKNKLSCHIRLINDVDQFLNAGLSSVPALRIGNTIIEHHSDNAMDEMIRSAVQFLMEEKPIQNT